MSRPKPEQKQRGYVRSPIDEKAAGIAKAARELYDMENPGHKTGGGISAKKLKSWARDLRQAENILRKIDTVYHAIQPTQLTASALSPLLLKRAQFLEELYEQKGGRPHDTYLVVALWLGLHGLKILYQKGHGKPHWREIGDHLIAEFGDVLPKREDTQDSATWAQKTFNRIKHLDMVERGINYSIRRNLQNGKHPEHIPPPVLPGQKSLLETLFGIDLAAPKTS